MESEATVVVTPLMRFVACNAYIDAMQTGAPTIHEVYVQ